MMFRRCNSALAAPTSPRSASWISPAYGAITIAGSGIGTNFVGIPNGAAAFQNHLNEFRLSMQNSRIGFRVDALVKGAHVIGYMESDYLGNNPGNVAVSSNSNTLRSRLYWVDVAKDKWEILGGQTWSLITPGRTGISPLPETSSTHRTLT